jgi:hypothetical protein
VCIELTRHFRFEKVEGNVQAGQKESDSFIKASTGSSAASYRAAFSLDLYTGSYSASRVPVVSPQSGLYLLLGTGGGTVGEHVCNIFGAVEPAPFREKRTV